MTDIKHLKMQIWGLQGLNRLNMLKNGTATKDLYDLTNSFLAGKFVKNMFDKETFKELKKSNYNNRIKSDRGIKVDYSDVFTRIEQELDNYNQPQ